VNGDEAYGRRFTKNGITFSYSIKITKLLAHWKSYWKVYVMAWFRIYFGLFMYGDFFYQLRVYVHMLYDEVMLHGDVVNSCWYDVIFYMMMTCYMMMLCFLMLWWDYVMWINLTCWCDGFLWNPNLLGETLVAFVETLEGV